MGWREFFTNMLSGGQWLLLGIVPPAIFALYFLKLRRRSVLVPSTYLWKTTLEEFQVNSLWQRLRQNLLLYLQLLLVGLLILACLRPGWKGTAQSLGRTIFLLDTSASMSATDVSPTRLEFAKKAIDERIAAMPPGEAAMLISFSNRARVEQSFTTDLSLLRQKINAIQPTQFNSDIREALQAAAGLANPGRVQSEAGDVEAAEPVPADVIIFSDGRFPESPDFSWGNLRPVYVRCGTDDARNLGIVGFAAEANPDKVGEVKAFAEIRNYTDQVENIELSLSLNGQLIDAIQATVPSQSGASVDFKFEGGDQGELLVELESSDHFELDDRAYAVVNPVQAVRGLVVSDGNAPLETFFRIAAQRGLAEIEYLTTKALEDSKYQRKILTEGVDFVLFDHCAPGQLPPANTIFWGQIPAENGWQAGVTVVNPKIIDLNAAHPLLRFISLGDVTIASARIVNSPPGSVELFSCVDGPLAAIGKRGVWQDLVLGFPLVDVAENGELGSNTDWPIRLSYPLFMRNILDLFGSSTALKSEWISTGASVPLSSIGPAQELHVAGPGKAEREVIPSSELAAVFHNTKSVGFYQVYDSASSNQPIQQFAVNLFDVNESNIRPQAELATSWSQVKAAPQWESRRIDLWRWFVGLAIVLLLGEGYLYTMRAN